MNQLGRPVTGVKIMLNDQDRSDDELEFGFAGTVGSQGRFSFDPDQLGHFDWCIGADQDYKITMTPDGLNAPDRATWYKPQTIWRGHLARGELKLNLKATVLGRIKTSTKGASGSRTPAYQVVNASTGKVVRKTQAAPWNVGPGTVDYVTVPAGTYKVTMAPKADASITPIGSTTRTVTVRAGATTAVAFEIKPGGTLKGRLKDAIGLTNERRGYSVTPGDNVPWWAPRDEADTAQCSQRSGGIGVVTVAKKGSTFKAKGCLAPSGRFTLKSLPSGTYTVFVKSSVLGAPNGRFLMKGGKKALYKVKAGSTRSAGTVKLVTDRAMVRGVITLPKVAHAWCDVMLFNAKGNEVSYTSDTATRTTRTHTTISYRVWAKFGTKARYSVGFSCTNDYWYEGLRNSADYPLGAPKEQIWFSGKDAIASAAKPAIVTKTIKGSKRASVGTPTITGTPKVGKTLHVKIPGLAKNGTTFVRWFVNNTLYDMCDAGEDCLFPDKRSFDLRSEYRGAKIKAQVIVWQDYRWTVMKTTKTVTVR